MTGDIGWTGLVLSFVLVAVAVALSFTRRLGLERSILWASARALVQLIAVGIALQLIFDHNHPLIWSWLWVLGMLLFAAEVAGMLETSEASVNSARPRARASLDERVPRGGPERAPLPDSRTAS